MIAPQTRRNVVPLSGFFIRIRRDGPCAAVAREKAAPPEAGPGAQSKPGDQRALSPVSLAAVQRSRSSHIWRVSASSGVRKAFGSSMVTTGTPLCTPP